MTLNDLKRDKPLTITIKEAAEIMGVTPRFLQMALQQQRFPFGTGVEMDRWTFYINTHRFILYMEGADLGGQANE